MTANSVTIGWGTPHPTDGTIGRGIGTLNMGGGTLAISGDLVLARGTTGSQGKVNMTGGTLTVAGNVNEGPDPASGSSTLNIDGGTMTVAGDLDVDNLQVGNNGRTASVSATGAVNIDGSLIVARRSSTSVNSGVLTDGTLDLSGASSVTINVDDLYVVQSLVASDDPLTGTLTLSTTGPNQINAARIWLGALSTGGIPDAHAVVHLGQDNTVHTDVLRVGYQKGFGDVDIVPGGTLELAGLSGAAADLRIGDVDTTTGTNPKPSTMDLRGGTFNATLDELVIGYHLYPWTHTVSGSGTGTLSFDAGTVTANSVAIGQGAVDPPNATYPNPAEGRGVGTLNMGGGTLDVAGSLGLGVGSPRAQGTLNLSGGTLSVAGDVAYGPGTGTIHITGGALHVAGSVTDGGGSSTLNLDNGTMTVGGNFQVDNLRVGLDGTGQLTVTGSSVRIGSGTGNDAVIGRTLASSDPTFVGTADFSSADTVDVDVDELRVGHRSGQGSSKARGTLSLGTTNTLTANTLIVGESDSTYQTTAGDESVVHLGGTNVVRANTIIIGGRRSSGVLDIAAGGTLDVASRSGGRADLYVARNDVGTQSRVTGVMDLSGATSFTALLDVLAAGDKGDTSDGRAVGVLTLAQTNHIDADEIIVGRSGNTGADQPADESQLHLGGGVNTILTPTLLVGDRKTTGLVDFATAGGTLNLGSAAARTEITLGRKSVGTANNAAGTMDLRNGTAHIFATAITLGQETNLGSSGTPSGTLWLADGTLDVAGDISENQPAGGAGNSTLNVVGNQTFSVGGVIAVDNFRVGYNAENGSVTYAAGSTARIGSGSGNLDVGLRTAGLTGTPPTVGILDASGTQGVEIDVANLRLGNILGSPSGEGSAQGTLILSQAGANAITADSIIVGDSPGRGNNVNSSIQLGAGTNSINTDTLVLGGQKSRGSMTIAPGGTLTLEGKTPGTPVDIDLGFNVTGNTGTSSVGTLDMTGGTLNATVDQMRLGRHSTGSGSGTGIFTFEAGSVTANSILLGTDSGNSTGTINFSGGTLSAYTIDDGGGDANFNWTGGTLHVGTFGFDLVQKQNNAASPSVLAPGRSLDQTTIQGNYDLLGGMIEIQMNSPIDQGDQNPDDEIGYDFVLVEGNATLNGDLSVSLVDGYVPALGDTFDVLQVNGTWDGDLITDPYAHLIGDSPGAHSWAVNLIDLAGGGHIFQLTAVPEPSGVVLAGLGLLGLLGCAWRRRFAGAARRR